MATVITSECINCGACEPECPNAAIYQGGVEWELNGIRHPPLAQDIFYIVPEKCTECVGFHDHEACAAVCPVDCCVPDPDLPESEEILIARARALHPDRTFPQDSPSRFRTAGAATRPAEETAAAPPPPRLPVAPLPPKPAATAAASKPTSAGAVTPAAPAPSPAVAKAAPPAPAAPRAPAAPVPSVAPVGTAAPTPAAPVEQKPAAAPAREKREKVFSGELPGSFDDAMAQLGTVRRDTPQSLKSQAALAQPLLGALPDWRKKVIEEAVGDRRYFTAARATGFNILQNIVVYPLVAAGIAAVLSQRTGFRVDLIAIGIGVAVLEALVRLRGLLRAMPAYCGAWYAAPLALLIAPLLNKLALLATRGTIPVDGFHGGEFADKLERERRYGEVYTLQERGNGFVLRLEFPRRVPPSAMKDRLGIPDDMPDYDYDLSIRNGFFVVKGHVTDKKLRKLAAVSPAFPPDFATKVELPRPVKAFKHRLRDKTLDVVLLRP